MVISQNPYIVLSEAVRMSPIQPFSANKRKVLLHFYVAMEINSLL